MREKFILDKYPRSVPRNPSIRKFLFMRYSHLEKRNVPVCVEAKNFDHAVSRLLSKWPAIPWRDWDYVQELEPLHDLGRLGETLKYEEPQ